MTTAPSPATLSAAALSPDQLHVKLTVFRRDKRREFALTLAGLSALAGVFAWLFAVSHVIEIRTLLITFLTGLALTTLQFVRRVWPSLSLTAEPTLANAERLRTELQAAADFARGGFVLEFLPVAPALMGNLTLVVLSTHFKAELRFDVGPALIFACLIALSAAAVVLNTRSTIKGLRRELSALDAAIAEMRPATAI